MKKITINVNIFFGGLSKNAQIEQWDLVFKAWLDSKSSEKKLMVLDEFQYLGKANSAFPSIFQRIWDTMLKDENVMVILCGSLISMMESQTLAYSSPLYGRITGQIKLKQIPFRHYHEFFPDKKNKSEKELVAYYAVTGGVPKYIESGHSGLVMKKIRTNLVDAHIAYVYEDVCLEKMWELNANGTWGSHFDKAGIDVWNHLEQTSKQVEWQRGVRQEYFILFSISGFTDELVRLAESKENLILYS